MNHYQCQSNLLKAMAHPARLHILQALAQQPACVCDLVALTHRRQPYVSQQLIVLRDAGLVVGQREGISVFYRLAHPELKTLLDTLQPLCQQHRTRQACLIDMPGVDDATQAAANDQLVDHQARLN